MKLITKFLSAITIALAIVWASSHVCYARATMPLSTPESEFEIIIESGLVRLFIDRYSPAYLRGFDINIGSIRERSALDDIARETGFSNPRDLQMFKFEPFAIPVRGQTQPWTGTQINFPIWLAVALAAIRPVCFSMRLIHRRYFKSTCGHA